MPNGIAVLLALILATTPALSQDRDAATLKALARAAFQSGESEVARKRLEALLTRYRGEDGSHASWRGRYKYSCYLSEVAHEYLRGGQLGDALEVLGEAADLHVPLRTGFDNGLASAAGGLHRRLAGLSSEQRYELLREWSLPTESRRTVRVLEAFVPTQAPPANFAKALGERPRDSSFAIAEIGEVSGLYSSAWELVQAAEQTGRLRRLIAELEELAKQNVANAEHVLLLAKIAAAKRRDDELAAVLVEDVRQLRDGLSAGNLAVDEALVEWLPYFYEPMGIDSGGWHYADGELRSSSVGLASNLSGQDAISTDERERLLHYHRPMLEDGTIEYEFYYEPERAHIHPALDRLALLLDAEGVREHWVTDGEYDETGLDPANASIAPQHRRGPERLPLLPDAWNKVQLALAGDTWNAKDQGFRVPAPGTDGWTASGLSLLRQLQGDFDIEATFDLLKLDKPAAGLNSGVYLQIEWADKARSRASVFLNVQDGRREVIAEVGLAGDDGNHVYLHHGVIPVESVSSLRFARRGKRLYFLVAADGLEQHRILAHVDLDDQPVPPGGIRLIARAGGAGRVTDVLWKRIVVRAADVTLRDVR